MIGKKITDFSLSNLGYVPLYERHSAVSLLSLEPLAP